MTATTTGLTLVVWLTSIASTPAYADASPCDVMTKAEVEHLLGVAVEPPQLSLQKTLCKFLQPGYGAGESKKKHVTIGIWRTDAADPESVNNRRLAISQDKSLLPVVTKDVPHLGDAAIWVWAGGYFGALYAFKGGTLEVAVKISGIPQAVALTAAKKIATKALGGAGKSGFAYGRPAVVSGDEDYAVPGILNPLYLGTFDPIPDDEMTRNYVVSLVQAFNGSCSSVPEIFAVMDYAFYYERKASKGSLDAANRGDLNKGFAQAAEQVGRSHPHILLEGREDAARFLKRHAKGDECLTPPVQRLYDHIAKLGLQRRSMPPDVDDDYRYQQLMTAAARKKYGYEPSLSARPAQQKQLFMVKQACLGFTKGAAFPAKMEGFCRCLVDAAVMSKLSESDLALLQEHFTNETMADISARNRTYDARKTACYQ